jgi:plastocyanin
MTSTAALVIILSLAVCNPVAAAKIEGRVIFEGLVPKEPMADENGLRDDLIRVDPKTGGLMHVVAYLEAKAEPVKSSLPAAKMDQSNHRFVPRVLAVQAGQPVIFSNSDPANHNVRTSSPVPTNEFNVFTGIDGSYRRAFVADPKHRPVRVGCDIHPWMRGWIYVFDHPFFATTNERGEFSIAEVPPGEYLLVIEQPDVSHKERRNIAIKAGEKLRLEFQATVQRN